MEGDPGKVICKEAERIKPAAVVMGTRGRSLIQRFGSTIPLSETSSYHVTEASSCDFLQCATGKCW